MGKAALEDQTSQSCSQSILDAQSCISACRRTLCYAKSLQLASPDIFQCRGRDVHACLLCSALEGSLPACLQALPAAPAYAAVVAQELQAPQPSCETSDTCSETGSSSHPPPRRSARRCKRKLLTLMDTHQAPTVSSPLLLDA